MSLFPYSDYPICYDITLSLVILILRVPLSPQWLRMNTSLHSLQPIVICDLSIDL